MSILSAWKLRTLAAKPRSAELSQLDASVAHLASEGPGAKDANVLAAHQAFGAWETKQPAELARVAAAAAELKTEISTVFWKGKSQLNSVRATNVRPVGWTYRAWNPAIETWTTALPAAERLPPMFSKAEIMRVNEAIARSKRATEFARDAMITIMGRKAFNSAPLPMEEAAYAQFFGDYNQGRAERILHNFKLLAIAFQSNPLIIDVRNTEYGTGCYAACFRFARGTKNARGALSLTGNVEMYMGRAFFGGGNYEKTSDDTIGTVVHEFSHGTIDAVDVPPVDRNGVFVKGRISDDPAHNDFGASTVNSVQASGMTKWGRKQGIYRAQSLAQHKPDYAVVNADNYGEFAKTILIHKKG